MLFLETKSGDPLSGELNRTIRGPWPRLVLAYSKRCPELLYLAVACLRLTDGEAWTVAAGHLAAQTLRNLVTLDCGFFHFCREWCLLHAAQASESTLETRKALIEDLFMVLPASCQRLAVARRPPDPNRLIHSCWSVGNRGARPAMLAVPQLPPVHYSA